MLLLTRIHTYARTHNSDAKFSTISSSSRRPVSCEIVTDLHSDSFQEEIDKIEDENDRLLSESLSGIADPVKRVQQLLWLNNKMRLNLRNLHALQQEKNMLKHKVCAISVHSGSFALISWRGVDILLQAKQSQCMFSSDSRSDARCECITRQEPPVNAGSLHAKTPRNAKKGTA